MNADRLNEIRDRVTHPLSRRLTDVYVGDVTDLLAALDAAEQQAVAAEARLAETQNLLHQFVTYFDAGGWTTEWPSVEAEVVKARAALTTHPKAKP